MIDPKLLRQSAAEVAGNLARRGFEFDVDAYLALEDRRKALQVETEQLQSERNASAKSIGKAKAQGEDIQPLLAAVKDLGERLEASENALQELQVQLRDIELGLPNLLADDWEKAGDLPGIRQSIYVGHESEMPSWGLVGLKYRDIDAVAHYIDDLLRATE